MTGKIDPQSRRWLDAAKILGLDPKATVACPKCGQGTLQVIDAPVDPINLDRWIECPLCRANNVLSMIEPAQAIKLFVLSDRQLSSVTEWQVAIDGERYPLRLGGGRSIEALGGFVSARLRDVETGFECNSWTIDEFMRQMPRIKFDHAWKHVLALQWAGNLGEIPAVWMAAAAYAQATDGVVFDRESRLIRSAAEARTVVERIERQMPTVEAIKPGKREMHTKEIGATGVHSVESRTVEGEAARAFADKMLKSGIMDK